MAEFRMPSLGADMDAGTLLEWYVKPGDAVKRGDIVALVDTDKAAIEIEIFEDGVVGDLLVPPGEKVPVGTTLATIRSNGGVPPAPAAAAVAAAAVPAEAVSAEGVAEDVAVEPAAEAPPSPPAVHATPAARRHALELGVDLSALEGTGKHGVITKADVDRAVQAAGATAPAVVRPPAIEEVAPPPEPLPERPLERRRVSPVARRRAAELGVDLSRVVGTGPDGAVGLDDVEKAARAAGPAEPPPPPSAPAEKPAARESEDRYAGMRRAIAAALGKSKREIPHYYLCTRVDMSRALRWLEEENLRRPVTERLLPAVLLFKAAALATHDQPEMNGFWLEDGFRASEAVHLGIGISLRQGGLIAPCIHDADKKDLSTLMADLRDLTKRARKLQLRSSEMTDATITVTSLGDQGVASVYGIIYPPQVALVGFGRIMDQPWAENGLLGVRPILEVTLAADHRASDGHRGGLYLAAIDRYLNSPEAL